MDVWEKEKCCANASRRSSIPTTGEKAPAIYIFIFELKCFNGKET